MDEVNKLIKDNKYVTAIEKLHNLNSSKDFKNKEFIYGNLSNLYKHFDCRKKTMKYSKNRMDNIYDDLGIDISSMYDITDFIRKKNLNVKTIIDVGVGRGTPGLYEPFENAKKILVEGDPRNKLYVECLCKKLPNTVSYMAAAGSEIGKCSFVLPNSSTNSVLLNYYSGKNNDNIVEVDQITLDSIDKEVNSPCILKLDTEGSELNVLNGSIEILKKIEIIIIEVRTKKHEDSIPGFNEVMEWMNKNNFRFIDMNKNYRYAFHEMHLSDIVFIKKNSIFDNNLKSIRINKLKRNLKNTLINKDEYEKRWGVIKKLQKNNKRDLAINKIFNLYIRTGENTDKIYNNLYNLYDHFGCKHKKVKYGKKLDDLWDICGLDIESVYDIFNYINRSKFEVKTIINFDKELELYNLYEYTKNMNKINIGNIIEGKEIDGNAILRINSKKEWDSFPKKMLKYIDLLVVRAIVTNTGKGDTNNFYIYDADHEISKYNYNFVDMIKIYDKQYGIITICDIIAVKKTSLLYKNKEYIPQTRISRIKNKHRKDFSNVSEDKIINNINNKY